MIRVIALGSLTEAHAVAQEWGRLHAEGASGIFTSPAWCLAAWRAFPDLGAPLLLIAVDSAGNFHGALPLTRSAQGPTWPASPLGDEHDVRVGPDLPVSTVVSALLRSVPHFAGGDQLLTDIRPDGLLTRIARSLRGCPAPFVRLRDPDEEFDALGCLPGWSRKRRRALRSARRRLEDCGKLTVQRLVDSASLGAVLPTFARSRLAAWEQRGRLSELPVMDRHLHFPEFLADAGSRLATEGRCLLACLHLDGEPIAQALYFRSPGADLLYMSTYQPMMAQYSPSHVLLSEAVRVAVAEGVQTLELGRGDEDYKFALGAEVRYLQDVVLAA